MEKPPKISEESSPLVENRGLSSRGMSSYCVLLNLGFLPGLGTLLARRWISGAAQVLLAVSGFVMVVFSAFVYYQNLILNEGVPTGDPKQQVWRIASGFIVFGIAWIWGLFSSICILREAKRKALPVPPVMTGT